MLCPNPSLEPPSAEHSQLHGASPDHCFQHGGRASAGWGAALLSAGIMQSQWKRNPSHHIHSSVAVHTKKQRGQGQHWAGTVAVVSTCLWAEKEIAASSKVLQGGEVSRDIFWPPRTGASEVQSLHPKTRPWLLPQLSSSPRRGQEMQEPPEKAKTSLTLWAHSVGC